jgi:hypothetical protein
LATTAGWVAIASAAIATGPAISRGASVSSSWGRASESTAIRGGRGSAISTTKAAASSTTAELSEIAIGCSSTASTSSRSSTATGTTSTESRTLTSNILEEGRDLLVGLLQEIDQITNNTSVATVEECCRDTCVTSTTSTTNSVNVVIDVGWEIIVDDVGDIGNVKTALKELVDDSEMFET